MSNETAKNVWGKTLWGSNIEKDISEVTGMKFKLFGYSEKALPVQSNWKNSYEIDESGSSKQEYVIIVQTANFLYELPEVVGDRISVDINHGNDHDIEAKMSLGQAVQKRKLKPIAIFVAYRCRNDRTEEGEPEEHFSACSLTQYRWDENCTKY